MFSFFPFSPFLLIIIYIFVLNNVNTYTFLFNVSRHAAGHRSFHAYIGGIVVVTQRIRIRLIRFCQTTVITRSTISGIAFLIKMKKYVFESVNKYKKISIIVRSFFLYWNLLRKYYKIANIFNFVKNLPSNSLKDNNRSSNAFGDAKAVFKRCKR